VLELLSYDFVWLAIGCSLILAGIHAYLGFHIVSRGVIFVDLSLAQVAALGAALATLMGFEEGSFVRYATALSATFVGAWVVSIARVRNDRIPQEAFIGILYAASAALTILLLSHEPGGMEELQHLLAGSILAVTPKEIVTIAVIYSVIGLVHYRFRDRFFLITEDREAAGRKGWRVQWWDFLFYVTFAIVVTSSVAVAGVLLVFSLLVIPPVVALFYASRHSTRLTLGWIIAMVGATLGVFASIQIDLPAGPSIIAVLVLILVLAALVNRLLNSRRPWATRGRARPRV
jgi:zinc/manganese transport system permease protein